MRYIKSTCGAVLLLCLGILGVHAQEIISASGGDATAIEGSVSLTLGQVVYSTHSGTTGSVETGVQQSYAILAVTGVEEALSIQLISFPNPASDFLRIEAENYDSNSLSYLLYTMNGKILENKKLSDNTTITMANLPPAIYFLKILDNQKELKTFKIIKY